MRDLVDLLTWLHPLTSLAVCAVLLLFYLWIRYTKGGEIRLSSVASPKVQSEWVREAFRGRKSTGLSERFELMDGAEFEAEVSKLFRDLGYIVRPTPPSNLHDVDLFLEMTGCRVAVQLKRWNAPVGDRSVYGLFTGRIHYGTNEAWLITTSRFTPQARKLAETTGVRLVDGAELARWLGSRREEGSSSSHRGDPSTSAQPAPLEEPLGALRRRAFGGPAETIGSGGSEGGKEGAGAVGKRRPATNA